MRDDTELKVRELVRSGEAWKAREILSGQIGQAKYDPDLYALYGELLLHLGDVYEAGKYLFLSGVPFTGKHKEAVDVFLGRQAKKDASAFFSLMPRRFTEANIDEYPASVRALLNERGYRKKDVGSIRTRNGAESEPLPWPVRFVFGGLTLLLLCALVIGLWTTIATLLGWVWT